MHSDSEALDHATQEILEHKWFFLLGGVLSIIAGAFSILMPHVATLAAELVIGAAFAACGLVGCVTAFRARKASRIAAGFLISVLALAAGVLLLLFPLAGVLTLTALLVAFFGAGGLLKLYFAWKMRPGGAWGWMLAGALLSLALAALIWIGLPETAFWVPGLLVGIDLVFYGTALLMMVIAARRLSNEGTARPASQTP